MSFDLLHEELVMRQAFGLDIPQTLDEVCDPARLALVVYDMQVGIVKQIENGQQITECFRFSKPLARREFGSFSRAICHSRRNSWACLSFVWRWLATRELGRRGQAVVLAGLPGISPHSRVESTAE